MTPVKIYSNADNLFDMFVYVSAITFVCAVASQVYLYVDEYIRNINNKLNFMSRMLTRQSDKIKISNKRIEFLETQIKNFTDKCDTYDHFMSTISKEMNGHEKKLELLENGLHDLSIHSHLNMDKIFRLEDKISKKIDSYTTIDV